MSIASKIVVSALMLFGVFIKSDHELLVNFSMIKMSKSCSSSSCNIFLFSVIGFCGCLNLAVTKSMRYSEVFFVSVQMDISCVLDASLISLPMLEFGMKLPLAPTVVWKYRVPSPPGTWVRGYFSGLISTLVSCKLH